jgi:hypothetical protein
MDRKETKLIACLISVLLVQYSFLIIRLDNTITNKTTKIKSGTGRNYYYSM